MNESAACRLWLARAYETTPPSPPWTDEDRLWADQAAARRVGEHASGEDFVAQRSALVAERLETRDTTIGRLRRSVTWRPWIGPAVIALAGLAGLATDALSAGTRINVLAPPLLGVLAWNLAVYAGLLARGVFAAFAGRTAKPGWLTRAVSGLGRRGIRYAGLGHLGLGRRGPGLVGPGSAIADGPGTRFVREWLHASAPLNGARAAAVLHAGAAALAAGLLAGLYLRGLAFEYRAGWDSTFLDPAQVRQLLGLVLGPASLVTGIALPDAAQLAGIRFSVGPGENAARWIHLYAATVGLLVVLPRTLLALRAAWQARRLAGTFPLPAADPYRQGLERRWRGSATRVRVVPFSYRASPASLRGLQALLATELGPDVELAVTPAEWPPAVGSDTSADAPADPAARSGSGPAPAEPFVAVVALFNLGATPEAETHVAFVRELQPRLAAPATLRVIVDETSFRERFASDPRRIDERRTAWRKALAETGCEPVFATLGAP